VVVGLVVIALAIRLPYLWTIPRFTDETAEVELGLRVARGELLPLTNRDPYIGALWTYVLAGAFAVGGPSLLTPRLIMAIMGAVTVVPTYLLGRSLAGGSNLVGLLAALLLALSPMHIVVNSHIAWSNCLTPLFITLGLWLGHAAVSRDRPRLLVPAGLAFGLGLQTHPVGALVLPGVAVAVAVARPRWLLRRWVWIAVLAAMLGSLNLLLANVRGDVDSLAAGSAVQAQYTGGAVLTPVIYIERLRLTLWLLSDSLSGVLAESGQLVGPFAGSASARLGLSLLALALIGVASMARRWDVLLLCAIASYVLLLPAVSGRFEAAVPKARYITPLLPACFAVASVALLKVVAWVEGQPGGALPPASGTGRLAGLASRVIGLLPRVGLGVTMAALLLNPLSSLSAYYAAAVQDGRTNDAFFQIVAGIESSRRPGDRVYVERGVLPSYTLGGGRWTSQLGLAARIYGWDLMALDVPRPDAQPVLGVAGPLVVRAVALPLMSRMYRVEQLPESPTSPSTMRLVYARGQQPGLLAMQRQDPREDVLRPARPPHVDVFVDGVAFPSALQFAPDGRLFFNEVRDGRVRIASPTGELQPEPFVVLPVAPGVEQGALGLALDPRFDVNHWVYVFYSEADADRRPVRNRVVRFTERDGRATEATAILDDLPINPTSAFIGSHNGGRIAFGPDGKLYVSVGEMAQRDRVPDRTSPVGKILRVNPDGTVPSGNPFGSYPAYATGFRNIVGLAFHPGTGQLYAADGGSGGFDEVNQIRPGRDYGFPWIDGGPDGVPGLEDPVWSSAEERLGITGLTVYTGSVFPEYTGDLFFCSYNTGVLRRVRLGGPTLERVEWIETVARDCRLDVTNGPDGTLYLSDLARIFRLAR
jgi:glucose/arabinose dehydrogenase/4-amino-4-deoxy-L-arabinose transferase-like glycosyltransferase